MPRSRSRSIQALCPERAHRSCRSSVLELMTVYSHFDAVACMDMHRKFKLCQLQAQCVHCQSPAEWSQCKNLSCGHLCSSGRLRKVESRADGRSSSKGACTCVFGDASVREQYAGMVRQCQVCEQENFFSCNSAVPYERQTCRPKGLAQTSKFSR